MSDSHKTHLMSHLLTLEATRITLPVTLAHLDPPTVGDLCRAAGATSFPEIREVVRRFKLDGYELDYVITPWMLREYFLGWDIESWEDFARQMHGIHWAFDYPLGEDAYPGERCHSRDDFEEWRNIIRVMMELPQNQWGVLNASFHRDKVADVLAPLRICVTWEDRTAPIGVVEARGSVQAMIASIQLDLLRGATFRHCAREDCKSAPFTVETRHNRIYCTPDCAHLVAVRNSRARASKKVIKKSPGKPKKRRT